MIKNKQTFNIKETAEIFIPDQMGRSSYLIALFISIVMLAAIGGIYTKLPQNVPLYFTLPWGELRLAGRLTLLLLPIISIVVVIVNIILGRISMKLSPLLPRVLAVGSVVIALMMFVSLFGIVQSLIL
jgi:hypothetical protein